MRRPLCLLCLFYVVAVLLFSELFPPACEVKETCPTVCGEVCQIEIKQDKSVLYLKSQTAKVICYFPDNLFTSTLKIGNIVKVRGKVRLFEEAANQGQFNAKEYYRILGYDYALSGCKGEVLSAEYHKYENTLYSIKEKVGAVYEQSLPQKYAGILKAMLLGEKGDMDADIKKLYQQNGISHILAISGMHITFLGMGVFYLCRKIFYPWNNRLWCKRKVYMTISSGISLFFIISFGIMTGNSASALRSIIMFSLFILAGFYGRTYDRITALAVSAVVLLMVNPKYIYHSGFLLSFGAVMGIAILMPVIRQCFPILGKKQSMVLEKMPKEKRRKKIKKKLATTIASSLSANLSVVLATLPIQLYFFYTYSTYSILLNLLVLPFVSIIMALGVFGGILGCFSPVLGNLLLMPCHGILWLYEFMCHGMEKLPFHTLTLGQPALWQMGIYYGVLVVVVVWKNYDKKNKQKWCGWFSIVFGIFILCVRPRFFTTCTMLDVGQGECLIIEEKYGSNILIDGGSSDVAFVGEYRIVPYLKSRGIDRLDYVFVSHADTDHISGILELLKDEKEEIKVACFVLTKFALEDETYEELLVAAEKRHVRILYVAADDRIQVGEIHWQCLYPGVEEVAHDNQQSMVLLMECQGISMLFTGDLTGEKEAVLSACGKIPDIDILKVAHHGSRYSSSAVFLESCSPRLALISAGRNSVYGHPHSETIERLEKVGSRIKCTADEGQITVRIHG